MEKNKLYVLIDKTLEPVYGCVQGGHVVAQWLLDHPKQNWNNQYLIYLSADIQKWKNKLELFDIEYSEFKEPDLGNKITALAIHGHDRVFKNLKTVTED
jgi:hypothetical protein